MDNAQNILDALNALNPCDCDYQQWTDVGMALKAEGMPCSVWDDWSSRDSARYNPGECEKKWQTFNGSGVTGGTIIHLAQTLGGYKLSGTLDWDDGLDAYYDEVMSSEARVEEPYQMAIRYLETLFRPDESVSFVHAAAFKEDKQKWVPADAGHVLKCSTLINKLKKKRTLEDAFGTINPSAGAWIRINPTEGAANKDVTRYAHALVESDDLEIETQKKMLVNFKLPIAALVESGGKSVHAVVKIDASNEAEYTQRVSFLFDWLAKHQFIVDENNKNPGRLSRLPGAERNGNIQRLILTNTGCSSWLEWMDYIEGFDDNLPEIHTARDLFENPTPEPPDVIEGILKKGAKMIVTGDSKSGKTCLLMNLAVCIAEGWKWLGHQCMQGKVLYLNLEVMQSDFEARYKAIYKAYSMPASDQGKDNFAWWNLRGKAEKLEKLAPKIIRRCRNQNYVAIIVDPIYKVNGGDENNGEAITRFCALFDKMAEETGASMIYVHHHAKGLQGAKKVMDRGSGSGVFSRDADAIIDFSTLVLTPDQKNLIKLMSGDLEKDPPTPLQMEVVLRSFRSPEPTNLFFEFPLHVLDSTHILEGAEVEGSPAANRMQSPNNQRSSQDKKDIVDACFNFVEKDGVAKFSEMYSCELCEVSDQTLKKYVALFPNDYEYEKGLVRRKK